MTDPGICPDCGLPQHKISFRYKPELVLATALDPRTSVDAKIVTFLRCSNPMGYAHYSERLETVCRTQT